MDGGQRASDSSLTRARPRAAAAGGGGGRRRRRRRGGGRAGPGHHAGGLPAGRARGGAADRRRGSAAAAAAGAAGRGLGAAGGRCPSPPALLCRAAPGLARAAKASPRRARAQALRERLNARGGFRAADALGGGGGAGGAGAAFGFAAAPGEGHLSRTVRRIFQQGFPEGRLGRALGRAGSPDGGGGAGDALRLLPGMAAAGLGAGRGYARRSGWDELSQLAARHCADEDMERPPEARAAALPYPNPIAALP